jgi:2-dehydro-3-deoxyphosphogluconate aldolase/(4S)-4-hydroxy-2-oxoglutarate aldolase
MNDRQAVLNDLLTTGVIAVIRADSGQQLVNVCRALARGGVRACEITMTTPGALEAIAAASKALSGEAMIGAGSVLDAATARAAILEGARFIFSPTLSVDVIEMAHRYDCVAVPGALTPTGGVDLHTAADWIKAGAVAIGVGSSLVKKDLLASGNWDELAALAQKYVDLVAAARA